MFVLRNLHVSGGNRDVLEIVKQPASYLSRLDLLTYAESLINQPS